MKEDLIEPDAEKQPFEAFNVDVNDLDSFKENKCPIDLKSNNYIKLKYKFGNTTKSKFESSKVNSLSGISFFAIFLSFIYSFSFYVLLITYILTLDKKILIFLIIVYILGSLLQIIVIPNPINYLTKAEFEEDMKKILSSYVLFQLTNGKKTKTATYQAKYTVDITGQIIIPRYINYVRIQGIQLYSKKDLNQLVKDFQMVNKSVKVNYKLMYNNEEIKLPNRPYAVGDKSNLYSINCFTTICCILLIQWLNALIGKFAKSKKCIDLIPAKLITSNFTSSPTKFIFHGSKYEIPSCVNIPIESNTEFDNDLEEFIRKKKEKEERDKQKKAEKEERERKRKANTKILSKFKNGDNYLIKVKKVYDDVFLRFDAWYPRGGHAWYEAELGSYDPNIQERIVRKDKMTIYYPEGYDIRIEVIRGLYSYTVTIGDDYTENFEYYHN